MADASVVDYTVSSLTIVDPFAAALPAQDPYQVLFDPDISSRFLQMFKSSLVVRSRSLSLT